VNDHDDSPRPNAATLTRPLLAAALVATALAAPTEAVAYDFYLRLADVEGESTSKGHKGDVDVISFGDGFSLATAGATGGGRAAGKAVCDGVTVTKYVDAASPKLLEALFTGKPIKEGTLSVDTVGESPRTFYKIEMGGVLVTQVKQASGSDGFLVESLTMQPSSYKFSYTPQMRDGSPGATIVASGSC